MGYLLGLFCFALSALFGYGVLNSTNAETSLSCLGLGVMCGFFGVVCFKAQSNSDNYGSTANPKRQTQSNNMPSLSTWKDGTIAGLKVGYLENGCFYGPYKKEAWKNDHIKGVYICAVDPQHPNARNLLETYAKMILADGHEPVQASVSMYGTVEQMDNGEIICKGAADIVTMCDYYK